VEGYLAMEQRQPPLKQSLTLAGNWPMAAALMIAERTGRAIRNKE